MDALGVLYAALSLVLYPSGIYLAGAAYIVSRAAGLPRGEAARSPWPGCAAVALAAALLPLPGSPLEALTSLKGVAPNVIVAALIISAACAFASEMRWTRRRIAVGASLALAMAALADGAATLSLPLIAGTPGALLSGARWCVAAALLISAPLLVRADDTTVSRLVRAAVLSTAALMAEALVLPSAAIAPVGAAVALGGVALYGLLIRLTRRLAIADSVVLFLPGIGCASAAVALGVLAARP